MIFIYFQINKRRNQIKMAEFNLESLKEKVKEIMEEKGAHDFSHIEISYDKLSNKVKNIVKPKLEKARKKLK